jgi:hypothetical protein
LGAELAGGDAQRAHDKCMLRRRWRGHDVAIHATHRSRRHHHRDGAAIELVIGADHDAVDIVDVDAGIGQRKLRRVVDHLFERPVAPRDHRTDGATDHGWLDS